MKRMAFGNDDLGKAGWVRREKSLLAFRWSRAEAIGEMQRNSGSN